MGYVDESGRKEVEIGVTGEGLEGGRQKEGEEDEGGEKEESELDVCGRR